MKKLVLTLTFLVITQAPAHADLPVIDITSIIDQLKAYYQQVQQYTTQLQQLQQEVQTATSALTMANNFVRDPSLGSAMGLMSVAGINLDLPINPWAVQSLTSGYGGMNSISGLTGKLSTLGSVVNTSYDNNHIYTCTDNNFACTQSNQNGYGSSGTQGMLTQLYQGIVDHNTVLNGLRAQLNSIQDPASREAAIGQAIIEDAWATSQGAQVNTVNGLAAIQTRINQQAMDEAMRQSGKQYVQAVP